MATDVGEETDSALVFASAKPRLEELIAEFKRCTPVANGWNRLLQNEEVRFARWWGQSTDGKKHDREGVSGKAFPWDGASDTQIHLANSIIDENVAILVVAFFRAAIRAAGVTTGDDEELGGNITKLMEWIMKTKQYRELVREVELSAQYMQTYGICVLHPTWVREVSAEIKRFTFEEVENFCKKAPPKTILSEFPEMIRNVEEEAEATQVAQFSFTQLVQAQFPTEFPEGTLPDELKEYKVSAKRARKFVRGLREEGMGEIPLPYICKNGPSITALKLWDEIFMPVWTTDVQKSWIFRREFMNEVELRSRAAMDDWNQDWVEQAVKMKGKQSSFRADGIIGSATSEVDIGWEFTWLEHNITNHDLIEVIHAFIRQIDEDGVPSVYWTIFHAAVSTDEEGHDIYAKHGLLDYAHNQVPFVVGTRERFGRSLFSTRGVPQMVSTRQREVKVQRDGLIDWTSIGVTPPLNVPDIGLKTKYKFGPAIQNTTRVGFEPSFLEVPTKGTPISMEVMELISKEVDNDFGRLSNDVPPTRAQVKQQMMVNGFLMMWQEALQQEFKLVEQFTTDAKYMKITGAEKPLPKGEDIAEQADLILEFDVRELDMEHVLAQYKVITQGILPVDSTGVIDRSKLVTAMLRAVNPSLAKELVTPQEGASQAIFRKTQNDLMLMFTGNLPDYGTDDNPTAGMQQKFLQEIMQKNPKYQRAAGAPNLGLPPGDPDFAKRLEDYQKNLQFNIAQQQNKLVGRTGVNPDGPDSGQQSGGGGMMGGMPMGQ